MAAADADPAARRWPPRKHRVNVGDQRELTELDFDRSAVLLAPGCYLNHPCEPNAMRSGVKVFAWRAIRRGEEIMRPYLPYAPDFIRREHRRHEHEASL